MKQKSKFPFFLKFNNIKLILRRLMKNGTFMKKDGNVDFSRNQIFFFEIQ